MQLGVDRGAQRVRPRQRDRARRNLDQPLPRQFRQDRRNRLPPRADAGGEHVPRRRRADHPPGRRALGGRAATVPIVALTAGAFAGDIQACRNAGMNDHLAKPIVTAELARVIERWARPADRRAPPSPASDTVSSDFPARFAERRRTSAQRLEVLRADIGRADAASLQPLLEAAVQLAHVIAGTAGMFGERALGHLASEVEQALQSAKARDDASAAAEPIERLRSALALAA